MLYLWHIIGILIFNKPNIMIRRKILLLFTVLAMVATSCKKDKKNEVDGIETRTSDAISLDISKFDAFFTKYPKFKVFEKDIKKLYTEKGNQYIWHDKKGPIEFAEVIYNRVNQIENDGLEKEIPYKSEFNELFEKSDRPDFDSEVLLSAMYLYYAKNVVEGVDASKSKQTGWYLPREKVDYVAYLDNLMDDPKLLKKDTSELFSQYYNLRKGLHRYRLIEKNGGWNKITMDAGVKTIKPGETANAIAQVRTRLFKEGYLKSDSKSTVYDDELVKAVEQYQIMNNRNNDKLIDQSLVKDLNIPVAERIKAISVNMERCRWISPDLNTAKNFISVNIPSYRMRYVHDGKEALASRVVVGKELNKTVVFSGNMSYLVFSPYWNIPKSIIEKEVKPGMEKNPDYLASHNMEWNDGNVRQLPGSGNSLGKVKFMFPNSNNIYLHDTPAKSLFKKEERAFSHGCVRVEKARDLALAITKNDGNWSTAKVDEAMNNTKETNYALKNKIPVYIAYFTAWADEDGNVSFYEDVYNRDNRLASMLYRS